jgi:hypothetical protein
MAPAKDDTTSKGSAILFPYEKLLFPYQLCNPSHPLSKCKSQPVPMTPFESRWLHSVIQGISCLYFNLSPPLTLTPCSIFALRLPNCTALFFSLAALTSPKSMATRRNNRLSPRPIPTGSSPVSPGETFSSALREERYVITRSSRKGYRTSRPKFDIIRSSRPKFR